MRAVALTGPGTVDITEVPPPRIDRERQVLVRNLVSTICGSDIHIMSHVDRASVSSLRAGFPGHESVGVVVDSADPAFCAGQQVLAVPSLDYAAGFAEVQALPAHFLIPLETPGLQADLAVLAQQLGTAVFGMRRFWPDGEGKVAVVLGSGPVGLFFVQLCRLLGFEKIIASDLHANRLGAARLMGATDTVHAPQEDVVEVVRTSNVIGADLVIEAAGTNETRLQSIDCVKTDGRIGFFGLPSEPGDLTIPFDRLFRRKPTLEFCYDAQAEPGHQSFRAALAGITNGSIEVRPVKPRLWPVDDFATALREASRGSAVIKAGVHFA